MSASDHLSKDQFQLFHGTNRKIKGGFINPSKQHGEEWEGDGPEAAFASNRVDVAAEYGKHVYEVEPSGYDENVGTDVYMSHEGYKVKRLLSQDEIDHHVKVVGPKIEAERDLAHRKWLGERGMESWSHEGDKHYHVRYDKDGNQHKTLLKKGQLRPGDPVK